MAEPRDGLAHDERRARRPATDRTLRRSRERELGGVLGGIAAYVDADPRWLRLGFSVVTLLTAGIALIPYALLWLLLPGPEG